MKKTGKNRFGIAILLASGVAIFFGSCEREIEGSVGEMVEVHFTLGDLSYGENQTVTRSAKELASETVIVPVNEEFCMYATLEESEDILLRAGTLTANTRLRIVAFRGTVDKGSCEYKVAANGVDLVPLSGTIGLVLPADTYTFVAYSYNSTASPDYSSSSTIITVPPTMDLLWGSKPDVSISDGIEVDIKLYHKLSQVTVVATTEAIAEKPAIKAISSVQISPGYRASMNLASGMIEKENSVAQNFSATWSGLNTTTVTSTPRTVYTDNEASISIQIGSMTIGENTTYTAIPTATFNTPLVLGSRYTFTIDFRRNLVWAGSNIYWTDDDGGKLTFDAPNTNIHANGQRYQGLFFKWGSLVGISGGGSESEAFSASTKVYIPVFNSVSDKTWSTTNPYSSWGDVVYISPSGTAGRYSSYLLDDERNTDNDYAYWKAKKGIFAVT
jgi:hypothetical protein